MDSLIDSFLLHHPEFQKVYQFSGRPTFLDNADRISFDVDEMFSALATVVIHQQLSGKVAKVFEERLRTASMGYISARNVFDLGFVGLKGIGLSTSKTKALMELSRQVCDGELSFANLADMSDEEVGNRICQVYGFGPWSAHMFLLFAMGRLDVWAPADLGVRKGYQMLYELDQLPSTFELSRERQRFAPYSSLATWFFWRVLEMK